MASEFDRDELDVARNYRWNWLSRFLLRKLSMKASYNLAEYLVGFANSIRHASPRDGYEWVDRRTSLFSKLDIETQADYIAGHLIEVESKTFKEGL